MPPKKDGGQKAELSPEEQAEAERLQLEAERDNVMVELQLMKGRIKALKADNDRLVMESSELKVKLAAATSDAAHILDHKQSEIERREESIVQLNARRTELEEQLLQKEERIQELERIQGLNEKKLREAEKVIDEKQELEDLVKEQEIITTRQRDTIERMQTRTDELEAQVAEAQQRIEELRVRVTSSTDLRILFGEPWMVACNRHRLKGPLPADRDFNTLACLGGKMLVAYGGSPTCEGREMAFLSVDTMFWEKADGVPAIRAAHARAGHSIATMGRTRMYVFGGRSVHNELLSDIMLFNYDTLKWTSPIVKGAPPSAREGHSMCSGRDRMYIFGGRDAEGLRNDVWCLDHETMLWSQLSTAGSPPSARFGASICISDDGRRLWLMGGNDDSQSLGDIFVLELDRMAWTMLGTLGQQPTPRHGHTAAIMGRYLVVSGGCNHTGGGDPRMARCTDTWVLDLNSYTWECLHDSPPNMSVAGGTNPRGEPTHPPMKAQAVYTAMAGNMIFTLKPNREECLDELEVLELSMPEDIETLRMRAQKENDIVSKLAINDRAEISPNSIELSWRAPTKNADRIKEYKLMLATPTGVVKEVFKGRSDTYKATGLRVNHEYVFCVKAIYDDGSFLWSDSKAFRTHT
ncbi:unnamed protein product [Pedinophyceae sp. YPF-701]|nr:unnamed protein product [Pedinophyceae sp. YPF-701]